MPVFDTSCVIFIDYDNLQPRQKTSGLLDVVTKALLQMPFGVDTVRAKCEVRVYGGWYEGERITDLAEKLTVEIQKKFPKWMRLPGHGKAHMTIHANAELAVALLQEPGHQLFNTYRRKRKPGNVRVENPADIGCRDEACPLPLMAKLLKKGKCPQTGCDVSSISLIYRHEQKIVDTMLTCDIIFAANRVDLIALISGDDDFIPPLRTVILQGAKAVRFHTQPNSRRASYSIRGMTLLEMDL